MVGTSVALCRIVTRQYVPPVRSNGKRGLRRASVELIAPSAGPSETAAIAAALERFLHDTAPVIVPAGPASSPWERAALAEGVGLPPPDPWGDSQPWG
jgi:hypothetical protein